MTILAIDPGPEVSAVVAWNGAMPTEMRIAPNAEIVKGLSSLGSAKARFLVIEKVASYGMAVGESVFETVFWSGRFAQAFISTGRKVGRIPRLDVKLHLCHDTRAKDKNGRRWRWR
jgi:hypothetical protein